MTQTLGSIVGIIGPLQISKAKAVRNDELASNGAHFAGY